MVSIKTTKFSSQTSKENYDKDNLTKNPVELLLFSKNQKITALSGEHQAVMFTCMATLEGSTPDQEIYQLVSDNSYMLFANYVKKALEEYLQNSTFNFDSRNLFGPCNYLSSYDATKDAIIISVLAYPLKYRQDQIICRVTLLMPEVPEDMIKTLEDSILYKINDNNYSRSSAPATQSDENNTLGQVSDDDLEEYASSSQVLHNDDSNNSDEIIDLSALGVSIMEENTSANTSVASGNC